MNERAVAGDEFQLRPVHLRFPEVDTTAIEYFMSFPVEEIAKQITIIDFNLLSNIQVGVTAFGDFINLRSPLSSCTKAGRTRKPNINL